MRRSDEPRTSPKPERGSRLSESRRLEIAGDVDQIAQLVVIGSSAGGIDALSTIVRSLAADLPVPILVAQHLNPNWPSHLPEILQRQTKLRVLAWRMRSDSSPARSTSFPPAAAQRSRTMRSASSSASHTAQARRSTTSSRAPPRRSRRD